MLNKYNILSKMRSLSNLKIYIQSNPQQELAAKVSSYSFIKYGFKNVEILKLHEINSLKDKFGKKYLRNGSMIRYDPNDLQSFTFLRFIPPKIHNDFCLVIDPDVFLVKDPTSELLKCITNNNFKMFCTNKDGKIKSEVCLINCNKFNLWDFDKLIEEMFLGKVDYQDIINFNFLSANKIGNLNENLNVWDNLNDSTIFLHTTNRITQPWKQGLKVDFKIHASRYNYLKNFLRKVSGLKYNKKLFQSRYIQHPNLEVNNFVKNIFKEAIDNNYLNINEIEHSIKNNYISKFFIDNLKFKKNLND